MKRAILSRFFDLVIDETDDHVVRHHRRQVDLDPPERRRQAEPIRPRIEARTDVDDGVVAVGGWIKRSKCYDREMPRIYEGLDADAIRARAAALERFARWQDANPARLSPEAALAGIAALYERLPPESRARPVVTSGVARLHAALAVLGRRT